MFEAALRFFSVDGGDDRVVSCACVDDESNSQHTALPIEQLTQPVSKPVQRLAGPVAYCSDITQPLVGVEKRSANLLHLSPEDGKTFVKVRLSLFSNGMMLQPLDSLRRETHIAWSPFSLVQACRLHTVEADNDLRQLRLFKISVFHHGSTHFFATEGGEADAQRARWCADVSRGIRVLTQSLFPNFCIRTDPIPGAIWTATRLLAGYLLLCDDLGVMMAYAELHAHCDLLATFAVYEDETCTSQVVRLAIDQHTCVSERVGIDCSCFSFEGYHFTARTCAEKMLWLRCISNLKVKLRHRTPNPSAEVLEDYRQAVTDCVKALRVPDHNESQLPLLPLRPRGNARASQPPGSMTNRMAVELAAPQLQPQTVTAPSSPTASSSPLGSPAIPNGAFAPLASRLTPIDSPMMKLRQLAEPIPLDMSVLEGRVSVVPPSCAELSPHAPDPQPNSPSLSAGRTCDAFGGVAEEVTAPISPSSANGQIVSPKVEGTVLSPTNYQTGGSPCGAHFPTGVGEKPLVSVVNGRWGPDGGLSLGLLSQPHIKQTHAPIADFEEELL